MKFSPEESRQMVEAFRELQEKYLTGEEHEDLQKLRDTEYSLMRMVRDVRQSMKDFNKIAEIRRRRSEEVALRERLQNLAQDVGSF